MKKKYYIYLILTGLLLLLSIIYLNYTNSDLKDYNINLKKEKLYFLDKESTNATITNSNKF